MNVFLSLQPNQQSTGLGKKSSLHTEFDSNALVRKHRPRHTNKATKLAPSAIAAEALRVCTEIEMCIFSPVIRGLVVDHVLPPDLPKVSCCAAFRLRVL